MHFLLRHFLLSALTFTITIRGTTPSASVPASVATIAVRVSLLASLGFSSLCCVTTEVFKMNWKFIDLVENELGDEILS
jgi:hypothetical protein